MLRLMFATADLPLHQPIDSGHQKAWEPQGSRAYFNWSANWRRFFQERPNPRPGNAFAVLLDSPHVLKD